MKFSGWLLPVSLVFFLFLVFMLSGCRSTPTPSIIPLIQTFRASSYQVYSVAFSPDGTMLASGGYEKEVRLWDPQTGELLRTLSGHTGSVYTVAISPDGIYLAGGSLDTTIRIWDLHNGKLCQTLLGHSSGGNTIAFSPDGKNLATGSSYANQVFMWDPTNGNLLRTLGDNQYIASPPHPILLPAPALAKRGYAGRR